MKLHLKLLCALPLTFSITASAIEFNELMQGFPPAPEARVSKANWLAYPQVRWALQNSNLMFPMATISRGHEQVNVLQKKEGINLDNITFNENEQKTTLAEALKNWNVDGFLVIHQGKIVYEKYRDGFEQNKAHSVASVTKSFTGLLAEMLAHEGKLDLSKQLSFYVSELAGTALGDATVQQNLNMEVPVTYEGGLNPAVDFFAAVGLLNSKGPKIHGIYEFLGKSIPNGEPGSALYYQNGSPEAVAWAISKVTGKPWAQLLSERVWSKLGAEHDANIIVDELSTAQASGGLSATLRDLGRFSEMLRNNGYYNGQQIVDKEVIAKIRKNAGNADLFAKSALSKGQADFSYRSFWYQTNNKYEAIQANGIFDQRLHISYGSEMSIVQLSSRKPEHGAIAHTTHTSQAFGEAVAEIAKRLNK